MISFVILPLKMAKTCSEKCPGVLIADHSHTCSSDNFQQKPDLPKVSGTYGLEMTVHQR